MILSLYKITDGENVINKTLSAPLQITINLKANVDIISPTLILADLSAADYSDYNYAHISELDRYYLVTDARRVNSKLIQLELHCDVLETYKADILASKARFYRNIKAGDYLQADLDYSTNKTVTKYYSDKELVKGEKSMVLTTIGGAANE